ncbi:MAG: hypothetical protein P1V35_07665 [Planctomycetota bacterium]|nr:hypothetical protein [Planctomycetota bacterium]
MSPLSTASLGQWVGSAILTLGLIACGAGTSSSDTIEFGPDNGVVASGTSALAANLSQAPWQVEYHGVRRLEFLTERPVVEYREKVSADGRGQFGIQVIDVASSGLDTASFLAEQAQNEGFNYRYRGFRVLDPFLFEINYTVQLLNQEQVVAGVDCTRILVRKRLGSAHTTPNHFIVDMEPNTGLVLGWQELTPSGVLLSKMEFESFGFGPADEPIPMGAGSLEETELDPQDLAGSNAPFAVLRPRLLPAEFRLSRAYEVRDASNKLWIRQVFTDGEGALIFMHKKQASANAGDSKASTLGILEQGQWTVVMGDVNGYSLLAVGKMGANEIEDFVSSCF